MSSIVFDGLVVSIRDHANRLVRTLIASDNADGMTAPPSEEAVRMLDAELPFSRVWTVNPVRSGPQT